MDCRLHIIRVDTERRNSKPTYRFVVVDCSRAKNYPANFVCMLPLMTDASRAKSASAFRNVFGDKSRDLAIRLLNKALLNESDAEIKTEIEKRLTLLEPKQARVLVCTECKKSFRTTNNRIYKHPFCSDCYSKLYGQKVILEKIRQ